MVYVVWSWPISPICNEISFIISAVCLTNNDRGDLPLGMFSFLDYLCIRMMLGGHTDIWRHHCNYCIWFSYQNAQITLKGSYTDILYTGRLEMGKLWSTFPQVSLRFCIPYWKVLCKGIALKRQYCRWLSLEYLQCVREPRFFVFIRQWAPFLEHF